MAQRAGVSGCGKNDEGTSSATAAEATSSAETTAEGTSSTGPSEAVLYGPCLTHECGPPGEAFCLTDPGEPPTASMCHPVCPEENADLCPASPFGGQIGCGDRIGFRGENYPLCSITCVDAPCPEGMFCGNSLCVWPQDAG